jgi:hypothetical protein
MKSIRILETWNVGLFHYYILYSNVGHTVTLTAHHLLFLTSPQVCSGCWLLPPFQPNPPILSSFYHSIRPKKTHHSLWNLMATCCLLFLWFIWPVKRWLCNVKFIGLVWCWNQIPSRWLQYPNHWISISLFQLNMEMLHWFLENEEGTSDWYF